MSGFNVPPEQVPVGLEEREYAKLMLRYIMIPKYRQYLTAQRYSLDLAATNNTPGSLSEDQRRKLALALGILTGAMQAQEMVHSAQDWALARLLDTAYLASSKLDEIEKVRQPKQVLTGILSTLGKKAIESLDLVVENVLLPALGLPLKGLPSAKTAEEFYTAGRKYLMAGLIGSAETCFKKCLELDRGSPVGQAASIALRTQIPTRKMSPEAEKKLMRVKELLLVKHLDGAIAAAREGIQTFPDDFAFYTNLAALIIADSQLDEADTLIGTALRLFPDSEEALLVRVRIDVITLRLGQARAATDRLQKLDPGNRKAQSNLDIINMMESM